MDVWNTTVVSFWGPAYLQVLLLLVSGSVYSPWPTKLNVEAETSIEAIVMLEIRFENGAMISLFKNKEVQPEVSKKVPKLISVRILPGRWFSGFSFSQMTFFVINPWNSNHGFLIGLQTTHFYYDVGVYHHLT